MTRGLRPFPVSTLSAALILSLLPLLGSCGRRVTPGTESAAHPDQQPLAATDRQLGDTDPQLTANSPFQNIRPEVTYVGDEACTRCHRGIAKSYHDHPMGRSLSAVAAASAIEKYTPEARDPFIANGLEYAVERQGTKVVHRESLRDDQGTELTGIRTEVQFAVGSGQRGRSYLSVQDGFVLMSPITWYPLKGIWDLSPGYQARNPHFGRAVVPECLFCHCNHVSPVADSINRYELPLFHGEVIGCERCHGPGELHARTRRAGEAPADIDPTIVNPGRLSPELREAICRQCHLQGEQRVLRAGRAAFDYRPGLPLEDFMVDFVKAQAGGGQTKFVSTVEQMTVSRCFLNSSADRKLGCISCHDPHVMPRPDQRLAFYRERCLACHTVQSCTLPEATRREQAKGDNCIICHMPRTGSEITHTAITDHRVLRKPEPPQNPADASWPQRGKPPLVIFDPHLGDAPSRPVARELGLALTRLAEEQTDLLARDLAEQALALLDPIAEARPNDLAIMEARGLAHWYLGQLERAFALFERVLEQAPRRESSLHYAASLASRLKRFEVARAYAERAIEANPWRWAYFQTLATILVQMDDWPATRVACERGLRLHPTNVPLQKMMLAAHLHLGKRAEAKRDLAIVLALTPSSQHENLKRWFRQQSP